MSIQRIINVSLLGSRPVVFNRGAAACRKVVLEVPPNIGISCRWMVFLVKKINSKQLGASKSGVGNFFRPRAVFEFILAIWAILLDKPHHFDMIYTRHAQHTARGPNVARGSFLFGPPRIKFCAFSFFFSIIAPFECIKTYHFGHWARTNFFFGPPEIWVVHPWYTRIKKSCCKNNSAGRFQGFGGPDFAHPCCK